MISLQIRHKNKVQFVSYVIFNNKAISDSPFVLKLRIQISSSF